MPGTDFTREQTLTAELRIGDTVLARDPGGRLAGFALVHTAPLAAGRPPDELRVLKLVARDAATFDRLLDAVEATALLSDIQRTSLRAQTAFADAYQRLIQQGFRAHWTDLRMSLVSHPELEPPGEAVVFSNWEI